jgi:hypothetical protein
VGRGRGFSYVSSSGEPVTGDEVLERIRGLAIPPAWWKVWMNAGNGTRAFTMSGVASDGADRAVTPGMIGLWPMCFWVEPPWGMN